MERRIALVTGAGAGIGAACVRMLLEGDCRVVAVGRDRSRLEALSDPSNSGRLIEVVADVREKARLDAALAGIDRLDYLVANAGVCRRTPVDAPGADAVFDDVITTNITGVWNTFRAAIGKLRRGSAAVAVSSGLGKLGRPGYSAYAASKHAVLGMVKCLAPELAPRGVRVNAVCPGWVDTTMAERDLAVTAREENIPVEAARRDAEKGIPLGRFVSAEETAALIRFLLLNDASAITGQGYNISCGEFTV